MVMFICTMPRRVLCQCQYFTRIHANDAIFFEFPCRKQTFPRVGNITVFDFQTNTCFPVRMTHFTARADVSLASCAILVPCNAPSTLDLALKLRPRFAIL
jgi:hypothetical protein